MYQKVASRPGQQRGGYISERYIDFALLEAKKPQAGQEGLSKSLSPF